MLSDIWLQSNCIFCYKTTVNSTYLFISATQHICKSQLNIYVEFNIYVDMRYAHLVFNRIPTYMLSFYIYVELRSSTFSVLPHSYMYIWWVILCEHFTVVLWHNMLLLCNQMSDSIQTDVDAKPGSGPFTSHTSRVRATFRPDTVGRWIRGLN